MSEETTAPDPDELRAAQRERWERSAEGWRAGREQMQAATDGVSRWMVDAIQPQPGQRVLELAAGLGDTGWLVAERILPGGVLISTDGSEPMQEQARVRASELDVPNVEFKLVDLEWIDVGTAEVDAVLCRWGYMFAVDREAAFRETRRVLKPGGRVALATWAAADRNQWATVGRRATYDAGLIDAMEDLGGLGPFGLPDLGALRELMEAAGLFEIETEEFGFTFSYADANAYWEATRNLSLAFRDLTDSLDARQEADLRERIADGLAPFTNADGIAIPAVANMATASA